SLLLLSVLPHPSPSALPLLSLHDALPISIWIGASKLYKLANGIPNTLIALNPWFYISLTVMILGTLLFIAGFLGELILRNHRNRSEEHTSALQSRFDLVCRLLLEKKKRPK